MKARIHPKAEIGIVRLKITNLDRSLRFYQEVIGLQLLRRETHLAELTADGEKVLLVLEESEHFHMMQGRNVSGLYHFAILVPDRVSLGLALRNLIKHQIPVGQGDHLVSEALYLNDPDRNGIEIYADRPRDTWQRDELGEYKMTTDPVDIQGLLDISEQAEWSGQPAGTKIGHVHFHVGDLNRARQFYTEVLGFDIVSHLGQDALFISAGGYHHHIGLNIWAGVGAPPNPEDATGLRYFTITLPDQEALQAVKDRLIQAGVVYQQEPDSISLTDPFGIAMRLVVAH
ncbi:VOC family protein [Paenibacillus sp. D2_2]|uniref:VOC family protein n=1 Tax=Paenibacillus sp. D2_2 TaxID=3073092 RepID=UPI00281644CB|nr:VOC family protein [Paenibacillus sp. D2_2]WMT42998.1 VOC family protein [Paenibacillus sp. D2_2]